MTKSQNKAFLKIVGERILSEANDLKRTPAALAEDLKIDVEFVNAVIAGEADIQDAQEFVRMMVNTYPITLKEVWIVEDDCTNGVKVMRAKESVESSRIFERLNRKGELTSYYEYRDTVMSRTAPFKPEWISQLRIVNDDDPNNPDVIYNNGHLLHQATFFIGEVNFYWESEGKKHCACMNTGDSNYITPFVPHSFTSRNPKKPGLILAMTFAGSVQNALDDFCRIGPKAADEMAGDPREKSTFYRRLSRHLAAESVSLMWLSKKMENPGRLDEIINGDTPSINEINEIALILNIRAIDLMVTNFDANEEVGIRRHVDCQPRIYPIDAESPAYNMFELTRIPRQPYLKGFNVEVLVGTGGDLTHSLHEYIYNYGDVPIILFWNDGQKEVLSPGDSAYVSPNISHRFELNDGDSKGYLILLRIPGNLTDSVIDEYSAFAMEGRGRICGETRRWF